jgi:hypothetical protein
VRPPPPQPPRTVKQVAFHDKIAFAREQRREPTQVEDRLWEHLRGRRHGVKLRRQHPVDDFVLDLYCPAAKLALETACGLRLTDPTTNGRHSTTNGARSNCSGGGFGCCACRSRK